MGAPICLKGWWRTWSAVGWDGLFGGVGGGDNYTNNPNKEFIKEKLLKGLEKARKAPKKDKTKNKNPNDK